MSALSSYYLIFKAIHIAFIVTWFAGLFYLPRLFIYHAESSDLISRQRFSTMERRLFGIMTIGAIFASIFGFVLIGINPAVIDYHWFHVKFVLVLLLIGYHYRCYRWIARLKDTTATDDTKWLRWFNEIPVAILFAIVILAVTKAF